VAVKATVRLARRICAAQDGKNYLNGIPVMRRGSGRARAVNDGSLRSVLTWPFGLGPQGLGKVPDCLVTGL
jgi:hypothetical protein